VFIPGPAAFDSIEDLSRVQQVPIRKLSFPFEDRLALFQESSKPWLRNIAGLARILPGGDVIESGDLPPALRISSTCPQRQTEGLMS
jgi:hypothetical protein